MAKKKSKYWVDDASILPEIVVTPQGNYPILDDAGNPGMTVGAIQDINPNAHIYERTYNQVPQADSFNTEKPQWWYDARADAQDQAHDLSHFFADLMTGFTASQMEHGWNKALDENASLRERASGVAEALSPALFVSPWARAYYGLTHLADENGVQKTWDRFSGGDYVGGLKSAAGDAFNLMLAGEGGYNSANNLLNFAASQGNKTAQGIQLARAINGDVRGTRFADYEPLSTRQNAPIYDGLTTRAASYSRQAKPQASSLGLGEANEILDNKNFLKQINDFAEKYGYQGLDEAGSYSSAELEAYAKALIDRHNKFYRGVGIPTNSEDLQSIKAVLGENATDEDILQYVSTHGRVGEDGFFVSPYNTIGDKYGKTAVVSRPYTLGKDRTKWFEEGDYNVAEGKDNGLENAFYDPWGTPQYSGAIGPLDYQPTQEAIDAFGFKYMPSSEIPTELVSKDDLIFRGWADENSFPLLSRKTPNVAGRISVPRITEENAASIIPEQWVTEAGVEENPFKFSGSNDLFTNYIYSKYISGQEVPGFTQNIETGLPKQVKNYLLHDTVDRNIREFEKEGYDEFMNQAYKDKISRVLDNVKVGKYKQRDYDKAGMSDNGGFYNDENNFISINADSSFPTDFVEEHEGRHLIDYTTSLLDSQHNKLEAAYDSDFLNIPNTEYAGSLKGYTHMNRERVTTNRDARRVLLGNKASWDINITDKIIDKMPDKEIFKAVESANGYGRRYIKFLRATGKLTTEKAQQFREAMKYVGMYGIPATIGATAYGISQQDDSVHAYGGLLDMASKYEMGGSLKSKSWNDLSMKEKSEMIKIGVNNGLTDLKDIRDRYNEYAGYVS